MTVLISSFPSDLHAEAILWGLKKKSVDSEMWKIYDFPSKMNISTRISNDRSKFNINYFHDSSIEGCKLDAYDLIWSRRRPKVRLSPNLHEADVDYAEKECKKFLANIKTLSSGSTIWVNNPDARELADNKLLQLENALKCGFKIPETLASNNPTDVRNFYREFNNQIIFKPFQAHDWSNLITRTRHTSYTSILTEDKIRNNDEAIMAAPGIYQELIDKQYEVRVLFCGNSCLATRINSQENEKAKTDWRSQQLHLTYTPHIIPQNIQYCCLQLLKRMSLLTASFDFIVRNNGEYIFLEINESGQFLFPECFNENILALDFFAEFLKSKDPGFAYEPRCPIKLADFFKTSEYEKVLENQKSPDVRRHLLQSTTEAS